MALRRPARASKLFVGPSRWSTSSERRSAFLYQDFEVFGRIYRCTPGLWTFSRPDCRFPPKLGRFQPQIATYGQMEKVPPGPISGAVVKQSRMDRVLFFYPRAPGFQTGQSCGLVLGPCGACDGRPARPRCLVRGPAGRHLYARSRPRGRGTVITVSANARNRYQLLTSPSGQFPLSCGNVGAIRRGDSQCVPNL